MSYNQSGRHAQPAWDGGPENPPWQPPADPRHQYPPQQQPYPQDPYPQQPYPAQEPAWREPEPQQPAWQQPERQQPAWQQPERQQPSWQQPEPQQPAWQQVPQQRAPQDDRWQQAPSGPSQEDRRWSYLRHSAGTSLRGINAIHVTRALERLHSRDQPLAPHGVTLFFVVEAPHQHMGYQMLSASRWGYSGPEYDNLLAFLTGLNATATTFIAQHEKQDRVWDPRDPDFLMVNVGDIERPAVPSRYVGIGMETLNTDARQWYETVPVLLSSGISSLQAMSYVPGEGLVRLVDGSEIRMVRDDNRRNRGNDLICNNPLDASQIYSVTPNVPEKCGAQLRQAWPAFLELATTLGDHLNPRGQVW